MWQKICLIQDIPLLGSRVVKQEAGDIAMFRTAENEIFALRDKCPHKGGPLSQGIVFGKTVACPLHGWNVCLDSGAAVAPDKGCTPVYTVKIEKGAVYLKLDPVILDRGP